MDRHRNILDNFFLWYESKRYHKLVIFFSSILLIFLLNNFLVLRAVWVKKEKINQDYLVVQRALQPFYLPVCTTSSCRSALTIPLFDSQQFIVNTPSFGSEHRFFLWPFISNPFDRLINPSLCGLSANSICYFFFYNAKNLRYSSLSLKFNWYFFYPIMFLIQGKDQASLLLAHIQPFHFSQLNLISLPEPMNLKEIKPSKKDRTVIFEEVSVSQLKFVGLFLEAQSKKCWGIIQKANEQISKVEIGDTLGFEHYVVIAIELKKIIAQASDMKETIQLLL